jgi:hypothetical protein
MRRMLEPKRDEVTGEWRILLISNQERIFTIQATNVIRGDYIKENETDEACSTHRRNEKVDCKKLE